MGVLDAKRPSIAFPSRRRGAAPSPRRRPPSWHPTDPLVLRRKPGCACGGGCPHCRAEHELEDTLQPKLRIGAPDDRYEREADRVADEVMRMPAPSGRWRTDEESFVRTGPVISRLPQHRDGEREQELVRAAGESAVSSDAEERIAALRGGGQPLSAPAFFEPRFGRDFSGVRVHTGAEAAEAAQSVNARAFTVGTNVVFGAGEYAPGTSDGRRLLAHELTHVAQQEDRPPHLIRRKVVDNDFHVPCRSSRTSGIPSGFTTVADVLRADEAEAIRICAAAAARLEANIAGTADPQLLDALRRRFHLDGNDPGVRKHWLPLLAKRYRIVANAISKNNRRYNCAAEGLEPSIDCRTRPGLAFTAGGSGETDLCDDFWGFADAFRGGVIAHEWFHSIFQWFGDCGVTNTDSAECYELFAREMGGTAGATDLIDCCEPPGPPAPPATVPPQPPGPGQIPPIPSLPFERFFF